jgi:hypothetical protein
LVVDAPRVAVIGRVAVERMSSGATRRECRSGERQSRAHRKESKIKFHDALL